VIADSSVEALVDVSIEAIEPANLSGIVICVMVVGGSFDGGKYRRSALRDRPSHDAPRSRNEAPVDGPSSGNGRRRLVRSRFERASCPVRERTGFAAAVVVCCPGEIVGGIARLPAV
jgi:hypothetical protein